VTTPGDAKVFEKMEAFKNQIWILKPGKNSNRGVGIHIFKGCKEVKDFLSTQARE
jgi:hypothetical protein